LAHGRLYRHGTLGAASQAQVAGRRTQRPRADVQRMTQEPGRLHRRKTRAPSGRTAYVNGRYVPHPQAHVHIEDRGLQFADAIYEVWGVTQGLLLDEEEHLDRLERSLHELQIPMPMSRTTFKFVLRELMRRNKVEEGLIYLQITRG